MSAPLFVVGHYRRQHDVMTAELADDYRKLARLDPEDIHRYGPALLELLDSYIDLVEQLIADTPLPRPRVHVDVDTNGRT